MTTAFAILVTSALALGLAWFNSRADLPQEHRYRSILVRSLLSIALLVLAWIVLGTVLSISDGAPMLLMVQAVAAIAPLIRKKLASSSQPV